MSSPALPRRLLLSALTPLLLSAWGCTSQPAASTPEKEADWETAHGRPSEAITAESANGSPPQSPVVLGYFTNWAHHRPAPCDFKTADVDASLFSHINYAFALIGVTDSGNKIESPEQLSERAAFEIVPSSEEDIPRLYAEVTALKDKNPKLKVMLSVGGWAFNDEPTAWIFSAMAETAERRGHFIRQAISYAREHGFDGIDLDWEFPGAPSRGGRPIDTKNYTSLLREFRAQMHEEAGASNQEELLLTVAAPAGEFFAQHQELGEIYKPLNWINLMTYDYHGGWEQKTGANAPLTGGKPDIETSIARFKTLGVPAEKIVLGFATYARGWSGVKEGRSGAAAPGKGPDGPCGAESLTAGQVSAWVEEGKYEGGWDEASKTPFAYSPEAQAYLSYDNSRSYQYKLEFLRSQELAGAMFWAIDLDDFKQGYPLIRQVSDFVLEAQ